MREVQSVEMGLCKVLVSLFWVLSCCMLTLGVIADSNDPLARDSSITNSNIIKSGHVEHSFEPIHIVTSIRPLALLLHDLTLDIAAVESLLSGNDDPHHFSLKPSHMKAVFDADLVVWLGDDFERFLVKVMARRPENARMNVSEIPHLSWPEGGDLHDHDHGHEHNHSAKRDMHLWLNPYNAKVIVDALAAHLSELYPEYTSVLQKNRDVIKANLDSEIQRAELLFSPHTHLGFAVDHDGYAHFAQAFGLHQEVSLTTSEGLSGSVKHIIRVREKLAEASCIIVGEGESNPQKVQALYDKKVVVVDPLARVNNFKSFSHYISALVDSFAECFFSGK